MIVEEILSLNALSHHHIKKTLITIHNIKNNAVTTDSLKVFPCAVYLRFLNRTQLHRGHRALGFSCKINMLYLSLIESNCPVRIIISYRCRNIESFQQYRSFGWWCQWYFKSKRRQIEECFRIMKTDFSARPVYLQDDNRIKAHLLICFLSLTIYRYLEKKLNLQYTCEELLDSLKAMNFAEIQEQGFIPLYKREKITNALHESCGFRTDYQFITKSKMKTIQKKSKGKE